MDQSGVLQGKILVDAWTNNKKVIDRNKDNIMQYILLKGHPNSLATIARSKYSIETINNTGIKTQELASVIGDWNQQLAKTDT